MTSSGFSLVEGKPSWVVRLEGEGFRLEEHSNDYRLFHLPGGAVLSWVLKLTDAASERVAVHRAFDVSDPEARKYLETVTKTGKLVLVLEGTGGTDAEISVGTAKLTRLLNQGLAYNGRLSSLNGADAVRTFNDLFSPVFREEGAEAAWAAVEKQIGLISISKPSVPATKPPETPSSEESSSEPQTARLPAKKPAAASDSERETGSRGEDFEPLLKAARPDLYRHNAFRIVELPVGASNRDLDKRQRIIDMASQTGAAVPPGSFRALPLEGIPAQDVFREAMDRLRDPVRRILDEVFWFWPLPEAGGGKDPAVGALGENRVRPAFEAWKNLGLSGGDAALPTHNLATLCHAVALELEDPEASKALKDVTPREAGAFWDLAYRAWKLLLEEDGFWRMLEERVREINDPRLPASAVRRIRRTLPLALLSVSARLAAQGAERGDAAAVERHRQAMSRSGLDPALVDRALREASQSLRDRVGVLCHTAEAEGEEDIEKGVELGERLLKEAKPLLAGVDILFPKGDATRAAAHDEVAVRALVLVVRYGNTVEGVWKEVLVVLRKLLPVAEGDAARQRIQENIATVEANIKFDEENQIYTKCWFCKKTEPDLAVSAEVQMYGDVTREYVGGGTRVKWKQNTLKVPRCRRCHGVHQKTDKLSGRFAVTGFILTALAAIGIFVAEKAYSEGCGPWIGLIVGGGLGAGLVAVIFAAIGRVIGLAGSPSGVKRESIKTTFPTVVEAQRQGWGVGAKPPGVN